MGKRRFSSKLIDVPLNGDGASQAVAQAVRDCLTSIESRYEVKAELHAVQTDSFLANSIVMIRVNVIAETNGVGLEEVI